MAGGFRSFLPGWGSTPTEFPSVLDISGKPETTAQTTRTANLVTYVFGEEAQRTMKGFGTGQRETKPPLYPKGPQETYRTKNDTFAQDMVLLGVAEESAADWVRPPITQEETALAATRVSVDCRQLSQGMKDVDWTKVIRPQKAPQTLLYHAIYVFPDLQLPPRLRTLILSQAGELL